MGHVFGDWILMVWDLIGYPYSATVSEMDLSSHLAWQDFVEHWYL